MFHPVTPRVPALGVVRGFVMALVALHHSRDFAAPRPYGPNTSPSLNPALSYALGHALLRAQVRVLVGPQRLLVGAKVVTSGGR
ncbi:hypothetical protein [uncultured Hymenobacter sp.]|uniref:hypothetical protein n=1 Tax=uncultured Hymenobacter sp. TaxID=170016 RepID=UPI0035CAAEF6